MSGGTSYNGWPCSDDPAAINVDTDYAAADGSVFPGGIRSGDVATVLGYVIESLDARVEPLVPGWNWGWSYRANVNNPSSLSCHASATAIDYNAPSHPNGGSMYAGWSDSQVTEIRRILAEVQGAIQWGADYSGTKDSMHFEVIVDAAELARVAAALPNAPTPEDDVTPEQLQDALIKALQSDAGQAAVGTAVDARLKVQLGSAQDPNAVLNKGMADRMRAEAVAALRDTGVAQ